MLKALSSFAAAISIVALSAPLGAQIKPEGVQAPAPPPPPPLTRPIRPDSEPVPLEENEEKQEEKQEEGADGIDESEGEANPASGTQPPTAEPAPGQATPAESAPAESEDGTQTPADVAPVEPPPDPPPPETPPAEAPPKETITVPPDEGQPEQLPEEFPAAQAPAPPTKATFIKGDLIYPGTRRLLSRYDHVGVSVGASIIDSDFFISLSPGMAWYFDFGLAMSLHLPLNLLIVDNLAAAAQGQFEFGDMKVRRQDWDDPSDFARIVRFLTYGRKEDSIYASVNTMRPNTVGHGMMINRYQGDIDTDRSLTSLIFDAYNEYGGFQLHTNDVIFQNLVFGGLAFVKPLSFFSDNPYLQSLSLGVEFAADMLAPRCILKNQGLPEDEDVCVQGTGHRAGRNRYGGPSLDDTFIRTDADTARPNVSTTEVMAVGGSAEMKFLKNDYFDVKAYTTFHSFLNDRGGWGLGAGVLGRINFGHHWRSALRVRGEFRTFTDGFLPGYFDTLYEVQKYAYVYRDTSEYQPAQVTPTKYQRVFGDPDNGIMPTELGQRFGYNAEVSYALFEGSRSGKVVALGLGITDSTGPDDTNFYLHIEGDVFGIVQLFGTYMRTNVRELDRVFSTIFSQDAVLLTGARVMVLPFLFVNAHYSRSFRVTRSAGSEYHLGNDLIVDRFGDPSPFFEQDRLFDNVQTLFIEVEFGWEFSDDDDDE